MLFYDWFCFLLIADCFSWSVGCVYVSLGLCVCSDVGLVCICLHRFVLHCCYAFVGLCLVCIVCGFVDIVMVYGFGLGFVFVLFVFNYVLWCVVSMHDDRMLSDVRRCIFDYVVVMRVRCCN